MRLVDADVLIQFLASNYGCDDCKADCRTCEIGFVKSDIQCMPTMEAEPIRHGHWIERTKVHPDLLNESTYHYECSNCGYWDTHGADVEVPYCWHCGAKMDEEETEDEGI